MGINPDFRDLLSEFNALEVRYLVVGAHAVIFYATPRYTKDLDVWVEPTPENAARAYAALARFGVPLGDLTIDDLSSPGTIFQIGVEPNRVDVLTLIEGVDFAEAWQRRTSSTYGDVPVGILGLNDLIVAKRTAGRPQDLLDLGHLERSRQQAE